MVGTQCVLEPGVSRPGINQKAVTNLADVAETLNGGGVECQERGRVEPDIVPEWIPDDVGEVGKGGRGRRLHEAVVAVFRCRCPGCTRCLPSRLSRLSRPPVKSRGLPPPPLPAPVTGTARSFPETSWRASGLECHMPPDRARSHGGRAHQRGHPAPRPELRTRTPDPW